MALVARRYGLLIAPPTTGVRLTLLLALLGLVGRIRRLQIPDEPLPRRDEEEWGR